MFNVYQFLSPRILIQSDLNNFYIIETDDYLFFYKKTYEKYTIEKKLKKDNPFNKRFSEIFKKETGTFELLELYQFIFNKDTKDIIEKIIETDETFKEICIKEKII